MKNFELNKKTMWIIIAVVLAALLVVAYFTGVFDFLKPKPTEPDEPAPVEDTQDGELQAEGNMIGANTDAITYDENGVADVGDVDEPNEPDVNQEAVLKQEAENAKPETTTQQTQPSTPPAQQPTSGGSGSGSGSSSGGTATWNGATVRAVNSVSELGSPQKPFETVMVNGVPYSWDGSMWFKVDTSTPPNDYTEIGEWDGTYVGY